MQLSEGLGTSRRTKNCNRETLALTMIHIECSSILEMGHSVRDDYRERILWKTLPDDVTRGVTDVPIIDGTTGILSCSSC